MLNATGSNINISLAQMVKIRSINWVLVIFGKQYVYMTQLSWHRPGEVDGISISTINTRDFIHPSLGQLVLLPLVHHHS